MSSREKESFQLHQCATAEALGAMLIELEKQLDVTRVAALLAENEGVPAWRIPGIFKMMGVKSYHSLLIDAFAKIDYARLEQDKAKARNSKNTDMIAENQATIDKYKRTINQYKDIVRNENHTLRDFDRIYIIAQKLQEMETKFGYPTDADGMTEQTTAVYKALATLLKELTALYSKSGGQNRGLARLLDFIYHLQNDAATKGVLESKGGDVFQPTDLQKYVDDFTKRHFPINYLIAQFEDRGEQDQMELMALVIKHHPKKFVALLKKQGGPAALRKLIEYTGQNPNKLCFKVTREAIIEKVETLRKNDRLMLLSTNQGDLVRAMLRACLNRPPLLAKSMIFLNELVREVGRTDLFRPKWLPPIKLMPIFKKIKYDSCFEDHFGETVLHNLQPDTDLAREYLEVLDSMDLAELSQALKKNYSDPETRDPIYAAENPVIKQWVQSEESRVRRILNHGIETRDQLILQYIDNLIDKTGLHALYYVAKAMISVDVAKKQKKITEARASELLNALARLCAEAVSNQGSMGTSVAKLLDLLQEGTSSPELRDLAGVVSNFHTMKNNQAAGNTAANTALLCDLAKTSPKQLGQLLKTNKGFTILFNGLGQQEGQIGPNEFKIILESLPADDLVSLLEAESSRTVVHEANRLFKDDGFMSDFFKEIIAKNKKAIISLLCLSIEKRQESLLPFLHQVITHRGFRQEMQFYQLSASGLILSKIDFDPGISDEALKNIYNQLKAIFKHRTVNVQSFLGPLAEQVYSEEGTAGAEYFLQGLELDQDEWRVAKAGFMPLPIDLLVHLKKLIPEPASARKRAETIYQDCTNQGGNNHPDSGSSTAPASST